MNFNELFSLSQDELILVKNFIDNIIKYKNLDNYYNDFDDMKQYKDYEEIIRKDTYGI